jgi:hypothetical protein
VHQQVVVQDVAAPEGDEDVLALAGHALDQVSAHGLADGLQIGTGCLRLPHRHARQALVQPFSPQANLWTFRHGDAFSPTPELSGPSDSQGGVACGIVLPR